MDTLIIGYIILFIVISLAYVIITTLIDKDPEQEEIKYLLIPRLTRIIHNIDSIHGNFRSNIGDIIETTCDNDRKGKRTFYIHSYGGYYRLTHKQVLKLESDYKIKII